MADGIKRKYENQLVEGDLVFFSFGKKSIDHVGLYLRNNKFVHVSTSKGVIGYTVLQTLQPLLI
jgi:lipoprotein Spr